MAGHRHGEADRFQSYKKIKSEIILSSRRVSADLYAGTKAAVHMYIMYKFVVVRKLGQEKKPGKEERYFYVGNCCVPAPPSPSSLPSRKES